MGSGLRKIAKNGVGMNRDNGTSQLHLQKEIIIGQDGKARVKDPHRLDKLLARSVITENHRHSGIRYYWLYVMANPTWLSAVDYSAPTYGPANGNFAIDAATAEDRLRKIIRYMHEMSLEKQKPYHAIVQHLCIFETPLRKLPLRLRETRKKKLIREALSVLGKAFEEIA